MNDMLQRTLGTGQIAAMLSVAGIGWDQVADAAMLHRGTFNSVYRVALTDGSALILKAEIPGQPWPSVADRLNDGQRQRLGGDIGRLVAGLHTITGMKPMNAASASTGPNL
jgi:hypothetical protein